MIDDYSSLSPSRPTLRATGWKRDQNLILETVSRQVGGMDGKQATGSCGKHLCNPNLQFLPLLSQCGSKYNFMNKNESHLAKLVQLFTAATSIVSATTAIVVASARFVPPKAALHRLRRASAAWNRER